MTIIFVDESGDASLSGNAYRYFVLGFMYCENPENFREVMKFYLKSLHVNDFYPKELKKLKFSFCRNKLRDDYGYLDQEINQYESYLPNIRKQVFNLINEYSTGTFATILDKTTVILKERWKTERLGNYLFAETLQLKVLHSDLNNPVIYFDRGRLNGEQEGDFREYVTNKEDFYEYKGHKKYNGCLGINGIRSHKEPCLWGADFISGAYYQQFAFSDNQWVNLLSKDKMIEEGFTKYFERNVTTS